MGKIIIANFKLAYFVLAEVFFLDKTKYLNSLKDN